MLVKNILLLKEVLYIEPKGQAQNSCLVLYPKVGSYNRVVIPI